MKTINICSKLNITCLNNYREILNTDYIFIPISDESKVLVKINSHVLKGDLVYDNQEKVYSSISGVVLNIVHLNNMKYLVIKNDYKELSKNNRARNLENIDKEKFLSYINNLEVKKILNSNINTLYVNAIDDDPYIYNKYMYIKNNSKDIAKIFHTIKDLFNINNIKLVIKNNYHDLLNDYKVDISFLRIPDIYPLGQKKLLSKYLDIKDNDCLIDLDDIIDVIYDVIKNKKRLEEYITINGNAILNPSVVKVKKYSYLNNLLTKFKLLDDYNVIINNSLCGPIKDPKNVIIDSTIKGIIINKKEVYKPNKCSKCGLCINVCPIKINPLEKNKKCTLCGLCNFVCPSNINLVDEVQR